MVNIKRLRIEDVYGDLNGLWVCLECYFVCYNQAQNWQILSDKKKSLNLIFGFIVDIIIEKKKIHWSGLVKEPTLIL